MSQNVDDLMFVMLTERGDTVDLRAHLVDGNVEWTVMVSSGNIMQAVPGTKSDSAIDALDKALIKWIERSVESPFL